MQNYQLISVEVYINMCVVGFGFKGVFLIHQFFESLFYTAGTKSKWVLESEKCFGFLIHKAEEKLGRSDELLGTIELKVGGNYKSVKFNNVKWVKLFIRLT